MLDQGQTNASDINQEGVMQKAFENFMNQFILPEIERRQERGELNKPLRLDKAQIIFRSGRGYEIRINEEVQALLKVKLKEEVEKSPGDLLNTDEIESFENITLTDSDDPNAGHVTILQLDGNWMMSFDFVYNKALTEQNIATAKQFLELAKYAYSNEYWAAFIDNLFSTSELLAKSILLSHSDSEYQQKASHKSIKSRYNRFASMGNTAPEIRKTFNKLASLRNPARYVSGPLTVTEPEAAEMLVQVNELLKYVEGLISR